MRGAGITGRRCSAARVLAAAESRHGPAMPRRAMRRPFMSSRSLAGLHRAAAILTLLVASAVVPTASNSAEAGPVAGSGTALAMAESPVPTDPNAAKAHAILKTYCASCHQAGRLIGPAAGGGLADILSLAAITIEPHLVRRGEPYASRLYHVVLDRHRPFELPDGAPWPSEEDLTRLRQYIGDLPADPPRCATADAPIGRSEVATAIDTAVAEAGEAAARDMRFVSLAHLANRCLGESELESYRQAVATVLNSLSWGARPVQLAAIGPSRALLVVKLADIGWTPAHWDALIAAEPLGGALDLGGAVTAPGGHARLVRGDWLAATALQAPLYAQLLGLPTTLSDTARLFGVDFDADSGTVRAPRGVIRQSAVTRGPRVIARHTADAARLWIAYDFAEIGDREGVDPFERPLGLVKGAAERYQWKADGARVILTLPNGHLAFAAFDAVGRRLDEPLPTVETPLARQVGRGAVGCMSCHSSGPVVFSDQMRPHLYEKFAGQKDIRDQALALHADHAVWMAAVTADVTSYLSAKSEAGVNPAGRQAGLAPVAALARRYRLDVDMAAIAAEVGLTVAGLEAELTRQAVAITDTTILPRLRQGSLSRAEADRLIARLRPAPAAPADTLAAAVPAHVAGPAQAVASSFDPTTVGFGPRRNTEADGPIVADFDGPLRLSIWTSQARYRVGDEMTVSARASAPCYLTLIGIDRSGKATVLFPSEFEPENRIDPRTTTTVPAVGALYRFRLPRAGTETVIGICQAGRRIPAGIELDYERQRFTVLGNFDNFERTSYRLDGQPANPRNERNRGTVRAQVEREGRSEMRVEARADARSERTARAAVRVIVE